MTVSRFLLEIHWLPAALPIALIGILNAAGLWVVAGEASKVQLDEGWRFPLYRQSGISWAELRRSINTGRAVAGLNIVAKIKQHGIIIWRLDGNTRY